MRQVRTAALAFASLISLPLLSAAAHADTWKPSEPIRFIVPYGPGGANDIISRALQGPLSEALGVPVIVENKPGASGSIAASYVSKAKPDGYTLLVGNTNTNAIVPLLQKTANYDALTDFSFVSQLGSAPIVCLASSGTGIKDMASLLAIAKERPDGLNYGHSGVGTMGQLTAELLSMSSNINMTGVAYKGQAPVISALMTHEIDLAFGGPAISTNTLAKEGKISIVGVTSAKPSPLVPGAPSIVSFMNGKTAEIWFALFAPPNTPSDVVTRLHDEIKKIMDLPETKERFASFSVSPQTSTPEELKGMVARDSEMWKQVIQDANITVE